MKIIMITYIHIDIHIEFDINLKLNLTLNYSKSVILHVFND